MRNYCNDCRVYITFGEPIMEHVVGVNGGIIEGVGNIVLPCGSCGKHLYSKSIPFMMNTGLKEIDGDVLVLYYETKRADFFPRKRGVLVRYTPKDGSPDYFETFMCKTAEFDRVI